MTNLALEHNFSLLVKYGSFSLGSLWLELTIPDNIQPPESVCRLEIRSVKDEVFAFCQAVKSKSKTGLLFFFAIYVSNYFITWLFTFFFRFQYASFAENQFKPWIFKISLCKFISGILLSFFLWFWYSCIFILISFIIILPHILSPYFLINLLLNNCFSIRHFPGFNLF